MAPASAAHSRRSLMWRARPMGGAGASKELAAQSAEPPAPRCGLYLCRGAIFLPRRPTLSSLREFKWNNLPYPSPPPPPLQIVALHAGRRWVCAVAGLGTSWVFLEERPSAAVKVALA